MIRIFRQLNPQRNIQGSKCEEQCTPVTVKREARPLESGKSDRERKRRLDDLDNSPHVPFFKPIIGELQKRGFAIMLTARDCFQVCGLADRHQLRYKRIGRHYGKNKILKMLGLLIRAGQLAPHALKEKPVIALSHVPGRSFSWRRS
jgi:hypothetical protein